MIGHYCNLAWRHLIRARLYSAINIVGLSLGIACCLVISLFIRNEFSYDRFHTNADRIFRPAFIEHWPGRDLYFNTVSPFPLAATLQELIPEIEKTVRVAEGTNIIRCGDKSFSERYHIADPSFFEVFTFPFTEGNAATALAEPNSVVITQRARAKYFGSEDAIGQRLSIKLRQESEDFVVTGVVANPPSNSSIAFDFVIPMTNAHKLWREGLLGSWFNVVPETYVLTRPGVTREQLEAKAPLLSERIIAKHPEVEKIELKFQPITDIHLNTAFPAGLEPTSSPIYSYILGGIALAILLIACINFMTLAVARAAGRAREVGIRKVSGAGRMQLLKQFWGETTVLSLLALVAAVVLAEFALPVFNDIADKHLTLQFDVWTLLIAVALVLAIGIIGGSYPGLILSRFQPADVLKGKLSISGRSRVRQILVMAQFALAITLTICTLSMTRQLTYIQSKPKGFEPSQIIVVPTNTGAEASQSLVGRLRQELAATGMGKDVSLALNTFGEGWMKIGFNAAPDDYRTANVNFIDEHFIPTMDIRLKEGRNFSTEHPTDLSQGVIVNEAFVKAFAIDSPIGKPLPGTLGQNIIIGVTDDFHFRSLHEEVTPLIFSMTPDNILKAVEDVNVSAPGMLRILVRGADASPGRSLQALQTAWQAVAGDLPFEPHFMEANIERQYRADQRLGQIVTLASVLAIVISCLGLFGLAAVSSIKRTKEIGVRKALGASSAAIVKLLSREAVWLVAISNLIAWPLAYFAMQRWLADFAYRESLSIVAFFAAGVLALAVALLTVCYHAVKASSANPVESLRYE